MTPGAALFRYTELYEELGRAARHSSSHAIQDVLSGVADAGGEPTPPLETASR